jgi:hypothetical protein
MFVNHNTQLLMRFVPHQILRNHDFSLFRLTHSGLSSNLTGEPYELVDIVLHLEGVKHDVARYLPGPLSKCIEDLSFAAA